MVVTLWGGPGPIQASPLAASGYADTTSSVADSTFREYSGWVIDSIEIDNHNIYDLEGERYRGLLFRTANRLHLVTRRQVIRRELLFKVGDKYDPDLAAETARNLRQRYPLNDAWIEAKELRPGSLLVRVVTTDQWSLSGGLRSAAREANETEYRIGVVERNFLGRAQFLSVNFYLRQSLPNYVQMQYRETRFFGNPWSLFATYRSDPLNRLLGLEVSRPYYSLAQTHSYRAEITDQAVEGRHLGTDGTLLARWMTHSDRFEAVVGFRRGPSRQKIGLFGSYMYTAVQTRDTAKYSDALDTLRFPLDSTYHLLTAGATFQRLVYATEHRLQSFGYVEDVALGPQATVSFGRAYLSSFNNYYYDLIRGDVTLTHKLGSNIVTIGYSRSQWLKFNETIRRRSSCDLLWYNNNLPFLTMVLKSHYESDRSGLSTPLVLGGKTGLRGYEAEYAAGSRLHVINTEARFFTNLELLSVKLGGALFSDVGRTWQRNEAMAINGYHWNIGAGLRISLEHLRRGEIIRIDFVHTELSTWEISIGTGQYF